MYIVSTKSNQAMVLEERKQRNLMLKIFTPKRSLIFTFM